MSENTTGAGKPAIQDILKDKDKLKKYIFPAIIGLVVLLLASSMFCSPNTSGAQSGGKVVFDPYEVIAVTVTGYEGCGSVSADVDQTIAKYAIQNVAMSSAATPRQKAAYERLINSISYEVSSVNNGSLKNGNTVEITAYYSSELLAELGLSYDGKPYIYKVSGLGDGTAYDPFNGLLVTFKGSEGNADVVFDTTMCDKFIKENVKFSADATGKNNGDSVVVVASYLVDADVSNTLLSPTQKEYVVTGLNHFAEKIDGVDMTEISRCLTDFANKRKETQEFQNLSSDPGVKFTSDVSYDITNLFYLTNPKNSTAHYVAIIKLTRKSTCIVAPEDSRDFTVGDIKEDVAYVAITFRYVTVTPDNVADFHDYTVDHSYTEPSADQNYKAVYNATVDMYQTVQGFDVADASI